jgi:receptor protein-tyrosine kinase
MEPVHEIDLPSEQASDPEAADAAERKPESARNGSLFSHFGPSLAQKIVVDENMLPASREQYRRLAATLHHAHASTGLRVVMIASAAPGEGKTLTASNLALTLSESYQRSVLLIDADLRRPSLHSVFKIDGVPGLSEGLMGSEERKMPLHQITPLLTVLPAGRPSSDPMAALTSPRMRRLVDEARETFAWVIIDTPPIGLLPDANLLATMVDGTILVVKAGVTPFELVKKAADIIGDGMLGVVLNRADLRSRKYGYGYYDYSTKPAKA